VRANPEAAKTKRQEKLTVPEARRGAQTVHRAIDILEVFSLDQPTHSLAEISQSVRLTIPTTHRLLKALLNKQMVVWEPTTRRYSLGAGVMRMAGVVLQRDDVLNIVHPHLVRLRSETEETAALHWLVGDQRVCVVELTSLHQIRMASGVGRAYPLYAGASGKAILAWLPADRTETLLDGAVAKQLLTEAAAHRVRKQLPEIRRTGYATSSGETVKGASALAAAIVDSTEHVIGAINVTGPADRLAEREIRRAAPALTEAASQIMRQLGRSFPTASA
jgi:DNA-binding IclR family transcriptional regulator